MGKETSLHFLPGTHQGLASLVYVYVLLSCNFCVSYQSIFYTFTAVFICMHYTSH